MARKMKDSGVEWIGEIPEDWKVNSIKNTCNVFGRIGFRGYTTEDLVDEGNGAITLSPTNIINSKLSLDKCSYISWDKYNESPEIKVFNGDIVLVKTASVGKVALIEECNNEMTINPQFVVLKNILVNNKFLYYVIMSDEIQIAISLDSVGGVIKTITQNNINNYKYALPSTLEQQKIVSFLDEKVIGIDNAIAKTKETIEDYKKYKQSVITEAVTKGLNPQAEMKDSGVEWVGRIPKHYKLVKFKYALKTNLQYGANESGVSFEVDLPRYIRITDITNDGKLKNTGKLSLTENMAKGFILNNGDILFARSGATVGKSFIYKSEYGKCGFAGYLIRAITNDNIIPQFVYFYTCSSLYDIWKNGIFIQATIQNIGADKYANMPLIIPESIEEQKEIVDYIEQKCAEIDNLISSKESIISELEIYKKSLIYEYVTGKKEV